MVSTPARPRADLVDTLRGIVSQHRDHVILAPYPGMKTRIA